MPPEDMSNSKLMKLFSFEFVVWSLGIVFAFGVGYQSLAGDVTTAINQVGKVKDQQIEFARNINQIKVSQAEAKVDRKSQAQDIIDLKHGQQRILDILEKRYDRK